MLGRAFIGKRVNPIFRKFGYWNLTDSFHEGMQSLEVVLMDLFLGGSETTATSLKWVILFMLHHPEVQVRLHLEVFVLLKRVF